MKKVFIIGNGFDLDLGWKTGYQDFFESNFCPIHPLGLGTCSMEEFLARKVGVDRWYDLERVLREYAEDGYEAHRKADPKDEHFFNVLRGSLTEYIKLATQKKINTDSLAINVLRAILSNGFFESIYTFNYTDLYDIAESAGMHFQFDFKYVHGNVAHNTIILGVDSHSDLRDGYAYLRKGNSEYYSSNHIRYDLQECDEVVFFGHSLGDMDYPYFKDFFFTQSHCSSRKDGKRITIFTKDNNSRIQIMEQLRLMNGGETEHLQNDNEFNIVMTDAPDKIVMNQFYAHLREDSVKAQNDYLDHLVSIV